MQGAAQRRARITTTDERPVHCANFTTIWRPLSLKGICFEDYEPGALVPGADAYYLLLVGGECYRKPSVRALRARDNLQQGAHDYCRQRIRLTAAGVGCARRMAFAGQILCLWRFGLPALSSFWSERGVAEENQQYPFLSALTFRTRLSLEPLPERRKTWLNISAEVAETGEIRISARRTNVRQGGGGGSFFRSAKEEKSMR